MIYEPGQSGGHTEGQVCLDRFEWLDCLHHHATDRHCDYFLSANDTHSSAICWNGRMEGFFIFRRNWPDGGTMSGSFCSGIETSPAPILSTRACTGRPETSGTKDP